jgi:hypothetical protein
VDVVGKTEIPDSFDAIMTAVTSQYGLPVSYMRVQTANLLSLKIPPRSKRELSTFLERDRSNLMREEISRTAISNTKLGLSLLNSFFEVNEFGCTTLLCCTAFNSLSALPVHLH